MSQPETRSAVLRSGPIRRPRQGVAASRYRGWSDSRRASRRAPWARSTCRSSSGQCWAGGRSGPPSRPWQVRPCTDHAEGAPITLVAPRSFALCNAVAVVVCAMLDCEPSPDRSESGPVNSCRRNRGLMQRRLLVVAVVAVVVVAAAALPAAAQPLCGGDNPRWVLVTYIGLRHVVQTDDGLIRPEWEPTSDVPMFLKVCDIAGVEAEQFDGSGPARTVIRLWNDAEPDGSAGPYAVVVKETPTAICAALPNCSDATESSPPLRPSRRR